MKLTWRLSKGSYTDILPLSRKCTMNFIAPYKIAVTGFKKQDLVWTDNNNETARGNLSVTGFLLYQTVGPSWQRTPQHVCVYRLFCDMINVMVAKILCGGKSIKCDLMMHGAKGTMYSCLYDDHYSGTDTGSSEPNSDGSLKLKLKLSAAVAESGSSFPKLCNVLYKFCILCFFINCVIYKF